MNKKDKLSLLQNYYLPGDIVIVKDIVFKDNDADSSHKRSEHDRVDHAANTGRPCVIIAIRDKYMYFLPFKGDYNEYKKLNYFSLEKKYTNKQSVINIAEIHKRHLNTGFAIINTIDSKEMCNLYNCFIDYQESVGLYRGYGNQDDEYLELSYDVICNWFNYKSQPKCKKLGKNVNLF